MNTQEFIERIEKLSPKQKTLLALQFKAQYLMSSASNGHSAERLVAYIIGDGNIAAGDFRNHLKDRLPEYMIPAAFVQLDKFPRLPNGKVDSQALPDPDESVEPSEADYTAPSTAIEKKLAAIWSEVLNFDPVGIHDNFFEIGGDSILSIQIIAKAGKAGITLKPNSIFEHQTIAELALSAGSGAERIKQNETITGEVTILPIQHWFFEEHKHAPHHWNQGLFFKDASNLDAGLLREAMYHLTTHHDALRLKFVKDREKWIASVGEPQKENVFQKIDLGHLPLPEQEAMIQENAALLQGELDLSEGALCQGVYFDCGERQPAKFMLFAHHLVVDAVSWGILIEDLKTICQQLKEGSEVSLPAKTTSFKEWGAHLSQLAGTDQIVKEHDFWQGQRQDLSTLPLDFETALPVREESGATINITLDKFTTQKLRSEALTTYNTRIDEFLLAVLTEVIGAWSGVANICIGLERHGRETMNTSLDLSNTVGWFTSYFPVSFGLNAADGAESILKSVKEQLRKIPKGGIGYGVLRYMNKGHSEEMNSPHHPPIIFNYLGNMASLNAGLLGSAEEIREGTRHPQSERYHLLEINAFIHEDQLNMRWGYSRQLHLPESIHKLVQAFEKTLLRFIEHCSAPNAGGFTPSDFPEAGLNQDDLDSLLGEIDQ